MTKQHTLGLVGGIAVGVFLGWYFAYYLDGYWPFTQITPPIPSNYPGSAVSSQLG